MKSLLLICVALSLTSIAAVCAGGAPPGGGETSPGKAQGENRAASMRLLGTGFGEPQVVMLKSMPPQFQLVFDRDMPTPGWTFSVDSVRVDDENHRVEIDVTEQGPDGIVAQVITPTKLKIPLGYMNRGRYFIELRTRRGTDADHAPTHALVVNCH